MHFLVIEDERALCETIVRSLRRLAYSVDCCYDGEKALELLGVERYDLVLLDLNLPGKDGMTVLRTLRQTDRETRVLILSARSEVEDKVEGLDAGADDYVVKPFMPRELTARIRAVLRRASAEGRARESAVPPADDRQEEIVRCGPLLMNETRFEATADGMPLKLSVKEFRLLLMFASRPGRVFTRGQLLENIWGNSFVDERTVDVHMLRLRKALAGTAAENLIETVRGVGYRCRPLD